MQPWEIVTRHRLWKLTGHDTRQALKYKQQAEEEMHPPLYYSWSRVTRDSHHSPMLPRANQDGRQNRGKISKSPSGCNIHVLIKHHWLIWDARHWLWCIYYMGDVGRRRCLKIKSIIVEYKGNASPALQLVEKSHTTDLLSMSMPIQSKCSCGCREHRENILNRSSL